MDPISSARSPSGAASFDSVAVSSDSVSVIDRPAVDRTGVVDHGRSTVSWGSILAGAFVATASSLILIALGAGLGFASVSPWEAEGVSAKAFTVSAAIWLIVTQWISACLGGYIAGRMRTRWVGTHTHEVFFRDTAHGLVAWALATVVLAAVIGSSILSMARAAADGASDAVVSQATNVTSAATSYGIDKLFRTPLDASPTNAQTTDRRTDVRNILANAVASGGVSANDRDYMSSLIVQQTGVSQDDARRRVDEFIAATKDAEAKAKSAADTARKSAAQAAIYMALSMAIGAFIASVSAALGGQLRDVHV